MYMYRLEQQDDPGPGKPRPGNQASEPIVLCASSSPHVHGPRGHTTSRHRGTRLSSRPLGPCSAIFQVLIFSTFSAFGQVLIVLKLGSTYVSHGDGAGARACHGPCRLGAF